MTNEWTLSTNPCSSKEKLIVGVSGGSDSLGLLLLLMEKFPNAPKRVLVGHVNYGLRGRESLKDEGLVRQFCETNGLSFRILRIKNFKGRVQRENRSLQDLAREIRYSFFQKLTQKEKAWGVAVAHHREDQAETVLDRLLRGAGPRGLTGLRAVQIFKFSGKSQSLKVWRPLLGYGKKQIQDFLVSRQIPWREDRTNQKNDYRRNQIRNQVLPFLKKWNPRIDEVLARVGEISAAEDFFLEEASKTLEKKLKSRTAKKTFSWSVSEFEKIPLALQRRWARHAAEKLTDKARGLSFDRIEEMIRLWKGFEKGPRDLGFGLKAGRNQTQAFLRLDKIK